MNLTALGLLIGLATTHSGEPVLAVEVDPGIEDAEQVKQWILDEGNAVLRARGVESTATQDAWRIGIAIGGMTYNYEVTLELERGGVAISDQPEPFRCECSDEQLLDRVEAAVGSAVEQLQRKPPPTPPPTKSTKTAQPQDELRPQRKLGGMGIAGAVLIPIGAAGVIAGGVLIGRGDVGTGGSAAQQREITDYRPVGIAVAVAGGGVLVTGIALLVADRVRARKRSVAFVPGASTSSVSFFLSGRF